MREPPSSVPLQWLRAKMTSSEFETELRELGFLTESPTDEWRSFLSAVNSGDEIWWYKSPPETWRWDAGRCGYAIVREGIVVDAMLTVMS